MKLVVAMASLALLAGCSSTVSGSPQRQPQVRVGTATTTATTTTTTESATVTATRPPSTSVTELPAPPTSIDPQADEQYCPQTITGALGKKMQVVVVATPDGRVNCDQAGAVLVDYYAARPDPQPGSKPIAVAGFACNQVPEPDLPQVICADGASLLYSMWPQGGG